MDSIYKNIPSPTAKNAKNALTYVKYVEVHIVHILHVYALPGPTFNFQVAARSYEGSDGSLAAAHPEAAGPPRPGAASRLSAGTASP